MKNFYSVLLVVFITACKTHEQLINSPELCKKLILFYDRDQEYRGMKLMQDPFFRILDSIRDKEGIGKIEYSKLPNEVQLEYGRKAREIANTMKWITKFEEDSIMKLQRKLDIKNTKEFLKIVNEHGYPNMERLNCNGYAAPFLIFGHSPERFWKKIEALINREKNRGSISKGDYNYIMWHIEGRKGNPIKNSTKDIIIRN